MSAFKVDGDFRHRMVPNGDDTVIYKKGIEVVTGTHRKKVFDKSKFIKVFPEFWLLGDHLSGSALMMLFKIGGMVQDGRFGHMVYCFNYKSFGMSKASFYRGLNELLEVCVIAKTEVPNQYEVNPNIIFNGKRKINE